MHALQSAGLSLLLSSTALLAEAGDSELQAQARLPESASTQPTSNRQGGPLGTGSRMADLLNHPAFAGYSRLLLPWDDRAVDADMRLDNISALLPYHSHVVPAVVVSGLNRMVDDVGSGKTVFFDIYTEEEKRLEPSKRHAGLFFFRSNPGAPFAVIAPGGGFAYVASVHEGFPYALDINKSAYNAFVLKYRAGMGAAIATQDMAAAITYIFDNASMLGVSTQGYSVWGSSAGARMAAAIGSHGVAAFGGKSLPRPVTVVMAYTGHSDTASDEPPTFIAVGEHDGIAPPALMERRVAALRKAARPVEYHKYPDLGHGFGTGAGTPAEGWVLEATRFWQRFTTQP